ncbi:hypothetical protein F5880DRAFT_748279 [Lentinula raphanica]|nr:hypothetical protein F5880DRAFT_748279 [Lentinula raphanica]
MRLFTFICSLVAVALLLASAADAVAENSSEFLFALTKPPSSDGDRVHNRSVDACNCPNHCYYTEGHECKYQRSVAIEGLTMSGTCQLNAYGALQCKDAKQVRSRRRRMVRARRREGSDIDSD